MTEYEKATAAMARVARAMENLLDAERAFNALVPEEFAHRRIDVSGLERDLSLVRQAVANWRMTLS